MRVSRALSAVASHASRLHAELEHLDALLDGGAPQNKEPDLREPDTRLRRPRRPKVSKEPGLLGGGLIRALLADAVFRLKAAGVGEEGGTRGADDDGVEGEAAHDPPEAPPDPEPGAGDPPFMASAFPEAYPGVGRRGKKAAFPSTHLFPVEDKRRRSEELSRLISAEASPLRRVYGEVVRRRGKWGRPRSGSPGRRPGRPPDYFTLDFSPVFVNLFEELEALGFTRRERLTLSRELVRRGHAEYVFELLSYAINIASRLVDEFELGDALSAFTPGLLEEHALQQLEEAREWWGALSWPTVEPEFLELFRSERWIRETVEDPEPTTLETAVAMCVALLAVSCIRFDFNEEVGYE